MRDHYERWWSDVHPALDDFLPISIGAPQANPVALTSSDWESVYADNPVHVLTAAGGPRGGPWNVQVERDGEYEIGKLMWALTRGGRRVYTRREPDPKTEIPAKLTGCFEAPVRINFSGREKGARNVTTRQTSPAGHDPVRVVRFPAGGGTYRHHPGRCT
jgi:hypothetical protein